GTATVGTEPFTWQVVGRCSGNGKGNFTIANQAKIEVFVTGAASMCKAYILYDREGEFKLTAEADGSITITPRFGYNYLADPYPCRIRVVTNRGVRTITFPPPMAITEE